MTDEEFQARLLKLPGPPYLEDFEDAGFALYMSGTKGQKAAFLEFRRNLPESERLTPERRICRALKEMLARTADGGDFQEAPEIQRLLAGLEYFLPAQLKEIFPYWKHESFDGFYLQNAIRIDSNTGYLNGICILISDQRVTPFQIKLRTSKMTESITWMECKVGRRGEGKGDMERTPWHREISNKFVEQGLSNEPIDWVYQLGIETGD